MAKGRGRNKRDKAQRAEQSVGSRGGGETPDEVGAAFRAVQQLTPRSGRGRDARGAPDRGAGTSVEVPRDDADARVLDSGLSLATTEVRTESSYAAEQAETDVEELRHKALSGDIYRDVSDFKMSTLKWVVGIIIAGVLGMIALTLTMNESLREDVIRLMEDLRGEVRRDGERINEGIDELDVRVRTLEAEPPVENR